MKQMSFPSATVVSVVCDAVALVLLIVFGIWGATWPFGFVIAFVLAGWDCAALTGAINVNRRRSEPNAFLLICQKINIVTHFGGLLAAVIIEIYSKGSCEETPEGCDDSTVKVTGIVILSVSLLCTLISRVYGMFIRDGDHERKRKVVREKIMEGTVFIFYPLALLSGFCSIDGPFLFVLNGFFIIVTCTICMLFQIPNFKGHSAIFMWSNISCGALLTIVGIILGVQGNTDQMGSSFIGLIMAAIGTAHVLLTEYYSNKHLQENKKMYGDVTVTALETASSD